MKDLYSAVGPALTLPVRIEGVPVDALVDTGAQSTIISRPMLHEVSKHLRAQGKPLPKLEPPSVKLYGKDGKTGGHQSSV